MIRNSPRSAWSSWLGGSTIPSARCAWKRRALTGAPLDRLTDAQGTELDRGVAEYVAAEQFNADRPESHLNLGLLYAAQRPLPKAQAALRAALERGPRFGPALVHLADLYRATGRDAECERVLRGPLKRR